LNKGTFWKYTKKRRKKENYNAPNLQICTDTTNIVLVQFVRIRLPASPVKASLGDAGGPKPIMISRHK
jgi:hypothetical protein